MDNRLVIVTNGNFFARLILDRLFERHAEQIAGVLIITGDYKKRRKFAALFELSKCTAAPYVMHKVMTYVAFSVAQRLYPKVPLGVGELAAAKGIPTFESVVVNCDATRSWVASHEPALLVSVSCPQLIGRKMLGIPRVASLNIHSSLLPAYAGLAPYFWVLSAGEKRTGTTVHYMTESFDTGNILRQESLDVQSGESAFCLFERLSRLGGELLNEAVDLALDHAEGTQQDLSQYTYFSNPSFKAYRAMRRRGYRLGRVGEVLRVIRREVGRTKQGDG